MIKKTTRYSLTYWIVVGTGLLIFSAALVFLLLLGSHMRLSGDDYCYNAVLVQKGFCGMQTHSYFEVSTYNGNRFSLTLLSGLFGLLPVWGSFLLITSSLLAWLGGLVVLLRWVSRQFNLYLSWIESLLAAEVFASFVLWGAPSLEQSFFWRSGMLPYFLPLVGGTWVLVLVCHMGEKHNQRWLLSSFIFLASLFVGGFSETGAAFWGGFWGLCLLFFLIRKLLVGGRTKLHLGLPLAAAFVGTGLAILLLAISPSTALRLASRSEPLDFSSLIPLLAWNIRVYLYINLMRRTLISLIPLLFGLGAGLWLVLSRWPNNQTKKQTTTGWKLVGVLLLFGFSGLFLISCVLLPVTFIQADYPPDRALIISQAVLVFAGVSGGILITLVLDRFVHYAKLKTPFWNHLLGIVCILFLGSSLVAPLQIVAVGSEKLPLFSRWSPLWDLRHQRLVAAGRNNVGRIKVMLLDHVIEDVGELSPDHEYWYNNCAEMYYGIDEIIADQPGW